MNEIRNIPEPHFICHPERWRLHLHLAAHLGAVQLATRSAAADLHLDEANASVLQTLLDKILERLRKLFGWSSTYRGTP